MFSSSPGCILQDGRRASSHHVQCSVRISCSHTKLSDFHICGVTLCLTFGHDVAAASAVATACFPFPPGGASQQRVFTHSMLLTADNKKSEFDRINWCVDLQCFCFEGHQPTPLIFFLVVSRVLHNILAIVLSSRESSIFFQFFSYWSRIGLSQYGLDIISVLSILYW